MNATDTAPRSAARQRVAVVRRLAVGWQHPVTRLISPVGLLEFDGELYRFSYISNAAVVHGFRVLLGFGDLHRSYESRTLFPLFAQRVMDPRRPDYGRYVSRLGLPDDATPWEQMTRSGGRREGDLLQLFPEPEMHADGSVSASFLVHGVRHVPESDLRDGEGQLISQEALVGRLMSLDVGEPLRFMRQPVNPVNERAVLTMTRDGFPLGWVPDLLLEDLYGLSEGEPERIEVVVQQVNGPDAPPHLRLLAQLTARPETHYEPFVGPSWQPLS